MQIEVGFLTDRGLVRDHNEDSLVIVNMSKELGKLAICVAVADGVGGQKFGEIASHLAVNELEKKVRNGDFWRNCCAEDMKSAFEDINELILNRILKNPDYSGMCTTLTAALLNNEQLLIGHIGDSRAYLIRDRKMRQLTNDHTWVREAIANGSLRESEALNHPKRSILTRAVGHEHSLNVDVVEQTIIQGDILILATDGLNNVQPKEICKMVQSRTNPQEACQRLIDLANVRGGQDNITAIVVRIETTEEQKRKAEIVHSIRRMLFGLFRSKRKKQVKDRQRRAAKTVQ